MGERGERVVVWVGLVAWVGAGVMGEGGKAGAWHNVGTGTWAAGLFLGACMQCNSDNV